MDRTCIIVVELSSVSGLLHMGTGVDLVSEVLSIKGSDIEETPALGTKPSNDFMLGMAEVGRGVKILLHIDRVLARDDWILLDNVA